MKHAVVAFFPTHEDLPGVAELDVDPFLVQYQRETSKLMWTGLVLGAVVFALSPILTVYVPLPSFWLSRAARDRHAHRLAGHSVYLVRQTVFLLKMVGGLCWGQHAKVRERLALSPYAQDPGTWRTS